MERKSTASFQENISTKYDYRQTDKVKPIYMYLQTSLLLFLGGGGGGKRYSINIALHMNSVFWKSCGRYNEIIDII